MKRFEDMGQQTLFGPTPMSLQGIYLRAEIKWLYVERIIEILTLTISNNQLSFKMKTFNQMLSK